MVIQLKDTVLCLESVERQSIHLIGQGKPHNNEAEQKLLRNYEIASHYGYPLYQCSNALNLSLLYSYMRNGEQTLRFARKALELQREDTNMRSTAILLTGEAFYKLGLYDSATFYLNKVLEASKFNIRCAAYMRLSDIAEKQGDTQKALEYEKLRIRNEKLYQQYVASYKYIVYNSDDLKMLNTLPVDIKNTINISFSPYAEVSLLDKHLSYNTRDICKYAPKTIKDILKNEFINKLNWGKLIVDSDKEVYTSIISDAIGTLDVIRLEEIMDSTHSFWLKTRSQFPLCQGCVYRNLSPPLTLYEVLHNRVYCHEK